MIGITLLSIIGVLLIGVTVLAVSSPGKLEPLKDKEGNRIVNSLTEKNLLKLVE
jgi:hypothetical protein